jgi:hypothetical protein
LEQVLDNVSSIVADIACAALDLMQSPEQHERIAAPCAKFVRFTTNILREKLKALIPPFVDEICGSHTEDILDIMIGARRCEARRQRLQQARKARAEKEAQRRALAQAAHDRMVALRHAQVCESMAAELEAEQFNSPKIEVVKDQLPIMGAGYNLFDPISINMFRKEVSDKSERQRRYQKCPITMKVGFLVSSLSRPALRLLGRYLPFPCGKTIDRWFHTHKKQAAQ